MILGVLAAYLYSIAVVWVSLEYLYTYYNIWVHEKNVNPLLRFIYLSSLLHWVKYRWHYPLSRVKVLFIFAAVGCIVDILDIGFYALNLTATRIENYGILYFSSLFVNWLVLSLFYSMFLKWQFPEYGRYNIIVSSVLGFYVQFYHIWVMPFSILIASLTTPPKLGIPDTPLGRIEIIEKLLCGL